jgi:hypothetical protein
MLLEMALQQFKNWVDEAERQSSYDAAVHCRPWLDIRFKMKT